VSVPALTRRAVVRGALVTVVGGVAGYLTVRASGADAGAPGGSAAGAYGAPSGGAGQPLLAVDRLQPDGVVVLTDAGIVLSRTSAGQVHGFSAVCTHQGCTVGASGGALECPCHGSRFAPATGAPIRGPATRPLAPVPVVVRNGEVYRS
jgi:Rieske Fe-S protein